MENRVRYLFLRPSLLLMQNFNTQMEFFSFQG